MSEILVVSLGKDVFQSVRPYQNLLTEDAFGNWYKIMGDVTLSTAEGYYLDMVNSGKPTDTEIANENYARENLQLFNVGLSLLNQDGSLQLDSDGNPIPVYSEAQVQAFARAYTGWTYANRNGTPPTALFNEPYFGGPMAAVESEHDDGEKALLNGTILPAGQTAKEDLDQALTNIFEHPNVAPFISQQLIQHLVKGDPSPAYVARVAAVFADNGQHVRGDMKAVITAILTDAEAREGDNVTSAQDGHLREPLLWTTAVLRGIGFENADPTGYYTLLSNNLGALNEKPYESPSVFNFFPPDYVISGTQLLEPEFSLENTGSIGVLRSFADLLNDTTGSETGVVLDLGPASPIGQAAALGPVSLVDKLDYIFMRGRMDPNIRTAILNEITPLTDPAQRIRIAVYLVITSGAYKINT